MKEFPGYNRTRGRGGPRTKRQLRVVNEKYVRLEAEKRYAKYLEERVVNIPSSVIL